MKENRRHKTLTLVVLLAIWAATGQATNTTSDMQDAASTPGTADCLAGKPISSPAFPVDMLRKGESGTVKLELTVDRCGNVLHAVVRKGSGRSFNEAAVASVLGATLNSNQLADVEGGKYQLEVNFAKPTTIIPSKIEWPRSHKSPRYLADPENTGFTSAVEADASIQGPPGSYWDSPYPGKDSRFVQLGDEHAREFWFFMGEGMPTLAVRYRPVTENGEAIVRVAMICEETPEDCIRITDFIMQGLPFAKAKKPG